MKRLVKITFSRSQEDDNKQTITTEKHGTKAVLYTVLTTGTGI